MIHPGRESSGEASSLCPISVARSSLAAPGRCGHFCCQPRRAPSPLVLSRRRAVPDSSVDIGFGEKLSQPSAGWPVSCADSRARLSFTSAWFVVFRQRIDSLSEQRLCWSYSSLVEVAGRCKGMAFDCMQDNRTTTLRVRCQYVATLVHQHGTTVTGSWCIGVSSNVSVLEAS